MSKTKHSFDTIVGLFLICIFAASLFFALAAGAKLYKDVSSTLEYQYTARTAMGYTVAKARQFDEAGAVAVGEFDGQRALILREAYDGVTYNTYIYCYDGYIRELLGEEGYTLTADMGEKIIAAEALDFSIDGGLLRVDCAAGDGTETAYVYLASYGEGALS